MNTNKELLSTIRDALGLVIGRADHRMESNTLHWSTVHRCQEALDALDQLETQQAGIAKLIEAGGAMKNAIDHLIQVENSTEDDDGRFGLDDLNGAWSSVGKYCKAWDAARQGQTLSNPAPHTS